MPANVLDHDKWERAKKAAREQKGADDFYALVSHIYQKMGGRFKSSSAEKLKKALDRFENGPDALERLEKAIAGSDRIFYLLEKAREGLVAVQRQVKGKHGMHWQKFYVRPGGEKAMPRGVLEKKEKDASDGLAAAGGILEKKRDADKIRKERARIYQIDLKERAAELIGSNSDRFHNLSYPLWEHVRSAYDNGKGTLQEVTAAARTVENNPEEIMDNWRWDVKDGWSKFTVSRPIKYDRGGPAGEQSLQRVSYRNHEIARQPGGVYEVRDQSGKKMKKTFVFVDEAKKAIDWKISPDKPQTHDFKFWLSVRDGGKSKYLSTHQIERIERRSTGSWNVVLKNGDQIYTSERLPRAAVERLGPKNLSSYELDAGTK